MDRKLEPHRRRNQETAFHCGKCGTIFAPPAEAPDRVAARIELLKAFESHKCDPAEQQASQSPASAEQKKTQSDPAGNGYSVPPIDPTSGSDT